jgi:hypothetical protein
MGKLRHARICVVEPYTRSGELGWLPAIHYWPTPPDGTNYQWRGIEPASGRYEDGMIIGRLVSPTATAPPSVEMMHEVRLMLLDDVAPWLHVIEALEGWQRSLHDWVLPRMILVAEGNKPPIMIVHGPPT